MKVILLLLTIIGMLVAGSSDTNKQELGDFHLYTVDNKAGTINAGLIEEALKSNGFTIGENANIQAEILHIYKEDNFKIYNNISFYHNTITLDLIKKYPYAGILVPMGMLVYQNYGEENLTIVVPRATTHAKVIGASTKDLEVLELAILKVVTKLFPNAVHSYSSESKTYGKELLTKYTLNVEEDTDFEDAKEEVEEGFEEIFAKEGFAMPSYFDLTDDLGEDSPYDFYVTYAICKMATLRAIIKKNPNAAVMGPCTTMIYKKKGENKIVMGFSSVYNWISSANVQDKASIDSLVDTQKSYENVFKELLKK